MATDCVTEFATELSPTVHAEQSPDLGSVAPHATPATPATRSTAQVIALARRYVEERFLGDPGFHGAHLVGSIIHADGDAPFPIYRDVDIAIVRDSDVHQEIEEVVCDGYVLECILSASSRYRRAEDILVKPGMACNLQKNSVIVDPHGELARLHQAVAEGFAKRYWVNLRAAKSVESAMASIALMQRARNPVEAVHGVCEFVMYCAEAIAVAHLEAPTHRRSLANLSVTLGDTPAERALYEEILAAFGTAQLSEAQVRVFLQQCTEAFDRAIAVKRTPVPFDWKLDPCIRDYLEKGTLEVIDEGLHRESIFWIALFFAISTIAIQQDGQPEEKALYGARFKAFLDALGLGSPAAVEQRIAQCLALHAKVGAYVDHFIATSPRLED